MIEHFAVTWLVNALWLVPLIAATTALCAGFARLGPRARHAAWMTALVLAVSLPALPAALPPTHPASAAQFDAQALPTLPAGLVPDSAPAADHLPLLALNQTWMKVILCLAGGAVAIALGRLLVAISAGRRLVEAARPCELDLDVGVVLNRAADSRLPPAILESESISSPVVIGALRAAILVPPGFTGLPWDEQRAALLHEMAHVSRRDYAWNLVCEAVSLPLAWHPAILSIKAGVRRSREAACDALAAEAMASRVTYAKCLVSLATRLGAAQPASAVVVGLIGKSDLEERLMNLLNPRPDRISGILRATGAAAFATAVLAPAVLLRVTPAFADEPVIARRLLAPAPVTPVVTQIPATPAAASAPKHAATVRRMVALQAATPPRPPSPSAPVAAEPPAPPAPPAEPMDGAEAHEHIVHGRYDAIVHRALEQALRAEKVTESDAMRHAMAELRASQVEMTRTEQARIHAEVARAMAELDKVHLDETLDKVRSQLQSPEFRNAIAEAARQAAAAATAAAATAAEAQADEAKN